MTSGIPEERPLLVLIDGNHLLNRNFHIPRFKDLGVTIDGNFRHTGATFGYLNSLRKIFEDHVIFGAEAINIWDAGGRNFRKDIDPTYKANRDGSSTELREQLDLVKSFVHALGVAQCWEVGQEADDIIGVMSARAVADGWDVLIISGDKDFYQLVSDNVHVLRPKMGDVPELLVTPQVVEERFGVPPSMFVELKALMGDGSDNIGGIEGIGPKIAASLIRANGTIADIIARDTHMVIAKDGSLKPASKSIQDKINSSKVKLASDRLLVEIRREVDFELNVRRSTFDGELFKSLCQKYEFNETLSLFNYFRSAFDRDRF